MYLNKEDRLRVEENIGQVSSPSELIYMISKFILSAWNQAPNDYTLLVVMKELVVDPKNSKFVNMLRDALAGNFSVAEIHCACRMAYDEFYQRVGRLHRALQCRNNGDLDGYKQALGPLLDALGKEVKKEAVSGLILPGGK